MQPFLLGIFIFLTAVAVIELIRYARNILTSPDRQLLRRRLREIPTPEREAVLDSIIREQTFSDVPFFNRLLKKFAFVHTLKRLKEQANAPYSVGFYLLLSLMLGVLGMTAGSLSGGGFMSLMIPAAAGGFVPWGYIIYKKKKRMERFRHQLPEAMDLISRSLKAGHAFSSGLKLAAQQMEDPLGVEFEATIHEINFGVSVPEALRHLARRVDCQDLQIFVVSVILQRETGGNLAEIMESNSRLIRERFKFQNHVRTLSAEGRLSAIVLFSLPIVVFLAIQALNPAYMQVLYSHPMGANLLWLAGGMMVAGMLIVRRMVNIQA